MAAKKRKKTPAPATALPVAPQVSPGAALSAGPQRERLVPAVYGAFFFALLLACSPALDSKFALPKALVLFAGVGALGLLLLARHWRGRLVAPARPALLLALALAGWWIVATPFALHLPTALHGEYDYFNGLWTHLCCLALFVATLLLPADTAAARSIVAFLVAAVAAVAAVNISETLGLSALGLNEVSTLGDRVAASAMMNFAVPFAAIALVRARHWGARAALAGLLALLLVSELLSQGRGAWIGLAVAGAILVFGLARAQARWQLVAVLLAGMLVLGGVAVTLSPAVAQRFATLTQVTQDEALGQRFIYYRAALRAIAEHPLAGIGFENFRNAYPAYRGADDVYFFSGIVPTMVHNGYLETALNNGVPALLLYLALVATALVKLGRQLAREDERDRRDLALGLAAALCAYLVQDLSGWLDLGLAPVFWVMLGLAANQARPAAAARAASGPLAAAPGVALLLLGLSLLAGGYARVTADARLFEAQALDVATQWHAVTPRLEQALVALPADSRTESVAGQIYGKRFLATHDVAAYARSRELLEASYGHNRYDRMRLINIIALERAALELGVIGTASAFAHAAVATLAQSERDNPAFQELKAGFLAAQGRLDEALGAIREARRLAPQEEHLRAREAEYLKSVR